MACDASFLKHYHTPVIHFGILHFKNKETLFYSVGLFHDIACNTRLYVMQKVTPRIAVGSRDESTKYDFPICSNSNVISI